MAQDSTWFKLEAGDNVFTYDADSGNSNLQITFTTAILYSGVQTMNDIYVLDQNFNLQGVIDEYVSIIWRPSYSEIGDFEIYLGATPKAIDLLRENRYVVRSSDTFY